jgi:hypothetical protein
MSINSAAQDNAGWRVSSLCDGGTCVGVSRQGESIVIGNTGNLDGGVTRFTVQEWHAFLAGVKLGDFDDLT